MVNYQKLYARLVGRVDDALEHLLHNIDDPQQVFRAALMLQAALREAEDTYIEDAEDKD